MINVDHGLYHDPYKLCHLFHPMHQTYLLLMKMTDFLVHVCSGSTRYR